MRHYYTFCDSPLGQLMLVCDGKALVGLYLDGQADAPEEVAGWTQDNDMQPFPQTKRQLREYFDGNLQQFTIPLSMHGTPFQKRVWDELTRIPFGQTISYGELAQRVGCPGGSRAVGLANGRNPVSVIVPCHRVINADGKLGGYGGGLARKQLLLTLESRQPAGRSAQK
jgi:methylated-DNA-[protein]-cysteine S-methyltransferase